MNHDGGRVVKDLPAGKTETQAKIYVFKVEKEPFVEKLCSLESLATH
jgi:hypothetical protein